jgi:hypothetical protein
METQDAHNLLMNLAIMGLECDKPQNYPHPAERLVKLGYDDPPGRLIDLSVWISFLNMSTVNHVTIGLADGSGYLNLTIKYEDGYTWSWAGMTDVYSNFIRKANIILRDSLRE